MKLNKKKKLIILIFLILTILLVGILGIFIYLDSIKHIGIWHHELKVYDINNKLIRDELLTVELRDNDTFFYNLEDKINNLELIQVNGTYKREKKNILLMFDEQQNRIYDSFYLKKGNLYFYNDNNYKYLTKDVVNVLEIPEIYKEITYNDYLDLLNNKEEAVVVAGTDACYYCVKYKQDTLIDIYSKYKVKFYHVDSEENWENLNLRGTPTTYLLKNGEVVKEIFGYVDYSNLNDSIKQFKYWQ